MKESPHLPTRGDFEVVGVVEDLTVVKFQAFDEQIGNGFTEKRMVSRLRKLFGGLVLLLAAIGLYGVTAYSNQKTAFPPPAGSTVLSKGSLFIFQPRGCGPDGYLINDSFLPPLN